MDTNKKHTLPRAIILAICFLLLAGACDNYVHDGIESDTPAREVSLSFNASIEKTEAAQSRSFTPIEDFSGNSYSFGMSITKSENGKEIFKGSPDMTATMTRSDVSAPWKWTLTLNSDGSEVTPAGPEGKALKVVAYYPVSADIKNAYTEGIPFDFSNKIALKQTDLLYNIDTIYPFTPSDASVATIPLRFRHAYTWIVLNITKYVEKGHLFKLHSVSLDNLGGSWIKNKGTIDPATGLPKEGATAGPIGVTVDPPVELSTTQVHTYEFLVPSFMDTKVGDGEIVLALNVNGIDELFTLDKVYLNKSDDGESYGFRQGYKNTYNLVYNNSALSLSIQNWTSEVIDCDFGGTITPPGKDSYMRVYFEDQKYLWPVGTYPGQQWATPYPQKPTYLDAGIHPFKDCLTTVAYGGNGDYVPVNTPDPTKLPTDGMKVTDDMNVYTLEGVYPIIHMTTSDISIVPVPWEDENGELVAKELCRKYRGGGFDDWRLPRASEMRAVFVLVGSNGQDFYSLNFNNDENRNKLYWTGTEVSINEAWSIYYNHASYYKNVKMVLSPLRKDVRASVRCVRDAS